MCIASSYNPTAFASFASSSTWVIDSGVTNHVTSIRFEFQSCTSTTDRRVRIADGSYNHLVGKGTVCVLPNLTLSSVLHVPSFSFNLLSVSALT